MEPKIEKSATVKRRPMPKSVREKLEAKERKKNASNDCSSEVEHTAKDGENVFTVPYPMPKSDKNKSERRKLEAKRRNHKKSMRGSSKAEFTADYRASRRTILPMSNRERFLAEINYDPEKSPDSFLAKKVYKNVSEERAKAASGKLIKGRFDPEMLTLNDFRKFTNIREILIDRIHRELKNPRARLANIDEYISDAHDLLTRKKICYSRLVFKTDFVFSKCYYYKQFDEVEEEDLHAKCTACACAYNKNEVINPPSVTVQEDPPVTQNQEFVQSPDLFFSRDNCHQLSNKNLSQSPDIVSQPVIPDQSVSQSPFDVVAPPAELDVTELQQPAITSTQKEPPDVPLELEKMLPVLDVKPEPLEKISCAEEFVAPSNEVNEYDIKKEEFSQVFSDYSSQVEIIFELAPASPILIPDDDPSTESFIAGMMAEIEPGPVVEASVSSNLETETVSPSPLHSVPETAERQPDIFAPSNVELVVASEKAKVAKPVNVFKRTFASTNDFGPQTKHNFRPLHIVKRARTVNINPQSAFVFIPEEVVNQKLLNSDEYDIDDSSEYSIHLPHEHGGHSQRLPSVSEILSNDCTYFRGSQLAEINSNDDMLENPKNASEFEVLGNDIQSNNPEICSPTAVRRPMEIAENAELVTSDNLPVGTSNDDMLETPKNAPELEVLRNDIYKITISAIIDNYPEICSPTVVETPMEIAENAELVASDNLFLGAPNDDMPENPKNTPQLEVLGNDYQEIAIPTIIHNNPEICFPTAVETPMEIAENASPTRSDAFTSMLVLNSNKTYTFVTNRKRKIIHNNPEICFPTAVETPMELAGNAELVASDSLPVGTSNDDMLETPKNAPELEVLGNDIQEIAIPTKIHNNPESCFPTAVETPMEIAENAEFITSSPVVFLTSLNPDVPAATASPTPSDASTSMLVLNTNETGTFVRTRKRKIRFDIQQWAKRMRTMGIPKPIQLNCNFLAVTQFQLKNVILSSKIGYIAYRSPRPVFNPYSGKKCPLMHAEIRTNAPTAYNTLEISGYTMSAVFQFTKQETADILNIFKSIGEFQYKFTDLEPQEDKTVLAHRVLYYLFKSLPQFTGVKLLCQGTVKDTKIETVFKSPLNLIEAIDPSDLDYIAQYKKQNQ